MKIKIFNAHRPIFTYTVTCMYTQANDNTLIIHHAFKIYLKING